MKDIFIDNNIAKNFAAPLDQNYKDLICWLNSFDSELVEKDPDKKIEFAHLVVSQKLLTEYFRSSKDCCKLNAIPSIINRMTQEGRIIKISKGDIEEFVNQKFNKRLEKKLLSNPEDRVHIVTVLLSNRKFCLTYDENLITDLVNFPGYTPTVERRPENINYK